MNTSMDNQQDSVLPHALAYSLLEYRRKNPTADQKRYLAEVAVMQAEDTLRGAEESKR